MSFSTKYIFLAILCLFVINIVFFFKQSHSITSTIENTNDYYSVYLSRDIENFFSSESEKTLLDVLGKFGKPTNSIKHMDKTKHVFLLPPNYTVDFPENSVVGFSVLTDSDGFVLSWSYSKIGSFMQDE